MNDANKKNLKKNYSTWAIQSILSNAKEENKTIIAWRIASGKKITANVFIRVIRKSRCELLLKATDPQSSKMLSTLVSGSEKLNFYMPDEMVLFQSDIKVYEASGDLVIKLPKMIAQIDRRKDMRLFLNDHCHAQTKFMKLNGHSNQLFDKSCFDISAGGLSFIVSKPESKFFSQGDLIKPMRIMVENKEVMALARVVNIFDVEPDAHNGLHYRGKKICVNFEQIDPMAKKLLADFVFRHVDLSEAV